MSDGQSNGQAERVALGRVVATERRPNTPHEFHFWTALDSPVGIGTIEVAVWDALAKIMERPLHAVLAERFNRGKIPSRVFCYVGGGWYWPGQTTQDLQDEMRRHLDAGYTMVKMKVGGLTLEQVTLVSVGASHSIGRVGKETSVCNVSEPRRYELSNKRIGRRVRLDLWGAEKHVRAVSE